MNLFSNKENIIDYILILGLIAFSGFPFFYDIDNHLLYFLLFSFLVWINRKPEIKLKFVRFILIFLLIFFFQTLVFNVFPIFSILGFFAKVFLAYFVIQSISINSFLRIFIQIMLFFSTISLIMFIPVLFNDSVINFYENFSFSYIRDIEVGSSRNTLFLLNLNFGDANNIISRNSGPFWEPGAFGGFLIIALLMNKILYRKIFNFKGMIFILAIISTFSTTSYIALMVLIIIIKTSFSFKNISVGILLVFSFIYIFQQIPFLQDKINIQKNKTVSEDLNYSRKNRFGSFIVDMKDFIDYPISGRGVNNLTRYNNAYDIEMNNRNNGITDFLVKFGIIGFLIYFIGVSHS